MLTSVRAGPRLEVIIILLCISGTRYLASAAPVTRLVVYRLYVVIMLDFRGHAAESISFLRHKFTFCMHFFISTRRSEDQNMIKLWTLNMNKFVLV